MTRSGPEVYTTPCVKKGGRMAYPKFRFTNSMAAMASPRSWSSATTRVCGGVGVAPTTADGGPGTGGTGTGPRLGRWLQLPLYAAPCRRRRLPLPPLVAQVRWGHPRPAASSPAPTC